MDELNIVFLGGSITWGAGADCYEKSYTYLTEQFFKSRLAGRKVNAYNAGISGTGSRVGVFRLNRDVLSLNPDIVFIEYAVNDSKEAVKDEEQVIASMEYIVRRLVLQNPNIKIVLLYSAMEGFKACTATHQKVADYYNIPSIDLQGEVSRLIASGERQWSELFVDTAHPSNLGHSLYADIIRRELSENWERYFSHNITLPQDTLARPVYSFPYIRDYSTVCWPAGWKEITIDDCKHIDAANIKKAMSSSRAGESVSFSFCGRHFGLYHYVGYNAGRLKITVDDLPADIFDCYYNCSGEYVSFYCKPGLKDGEHTVTLEIDDSRNPASADSYVSIAGFLVD